MVTDQATGHWCHLPNLHVYKIERGLEQPISAEASAWLLKATVIP